MATCSHCFRPWEVAELRYERQLIIPQIGQKGQRMLGDSVVTVIGSGGLGSALLTYLTCAGIGTIRILDCDVVSESNLNRQFLHGTNDIGKLKVISAEEKLSRMNPEVRLILHSEKLDRGNAESLLSGSTVVVDCVDNIETRVVAAEACMSLDIPLVEGGIHGFYGFVMTIGRDSPCLSCLGYDKIKSKGAVPVLGATAGVIGSLQATECIKLIVEAGEPLFGRMVNYDGLTYSFDVIDIEKSNDCPVHAKFVY